MAEALEREINLLASADAVVYKASEAIEPLEEAWEDAWDAQAEALKEELREGGTMRDPSEHSILTATRRAHAEVYRAWRRADRALKRAQRVCTSRRDRISAYQTMFKNLGAEARVQDYLAQREPEPVE